MAPKWLSFSEEGKRNSVFSPFTSSRKEDCQDWSGQLNHSFFDQESIYDADENTLIANAGALRKRLSLFARNRFDDQSQLKRIDRTTSQPVSRHDSRPSSRDRARSQVRFPRRRSSKVPTNSSNTSLSGDPILRWIRGDDREVRPATAPNTPLTEEDGKWPCRIQLECITNPFSPTRNEKGDHIGTI